MCKVTFTIETAWTAKVDDVVFSPSDVNYNYPRETNSEYAHEIHFDCRFRIRLSLRGGKSRSESRDPDALLELIQYLIAHFWVSLHHTTGRLHRHRMKVFLLGGRGIAANPHLVAQALRRSSSSISLLVPSTATWRSPLESAWLHNNGSRQVVAPWVMASCLIVAGTVCSAHNNVSRTKLDVGAVVMAPENSTMTSQTSANEKETTDVINWSGTHKITIDNDKLWEPETVQDVENFVMECHRRGQAIRPIGSSLSPNGIALNSAGMIQMANIDRVLEINTENQTITVEAGITVQRVVESLRPYGLTLPNLASIAEQQMGGFTQVGAHGTGKAIAPVDHYITRLKLVTPGLGTIVLSKEQDGALFELAKVAVGCLGVVVEVTMQCVPAHNLLEHTFVLTRQEAKERLDELLSKHKHMRYMWIPYTDTVVCVTNDPEHLVDKSVPRNKLSKGSQEDKKRPMISLFEQLCKEHRVPFSKDDVKGMGFGELRDALLAFAPLDTEHVKRCNKAEAEFWIMSEGYQTKPSDQLLQFDCGGQVSLDMIPRVFFCFIPLMNSLSYNKAMGPGGLFSNGYTRTQQR